MANASLHREDFRHDREPHPDTQENYRQREREYHPGPRSGDPFANSPQFGAAERRHRQGNDDIYGSHHQHGGSMYGSEFRHAGPDRVSPQRQGGHDVDWRVRFDDPRFGLHARGLGPNGQGSGGHDWEPEQSPQGGYGYFGMSGREQAFPEQSGQYHGGSYSGHTRHPDPDYHEWRLEQIRKLDRDYNDWRQERYQKFATDFDSWRSNRPRDALSQTGETTASGGSQDGGSSASQAGAVPKPDEKT